MFLKEWEILRRAEACAGCAKPFQPGDEATARLSSAGHALSREDFCPACWDGAPSDPAALFWRARVPEPRDAKREPFDAAELFGILKRLLEEGDPARARLCYLLSLYCSRKRLLRLKGIERKEGGEILVFVTPRTRKEYRIPSVALTLEDMAAARDELARLAAG
jgi:hypothetical protein